ncbi:MAG: hypothetical protein ABSC72_12740 [Methylovirgula sp.]
MRLSHSFSAAANGLSLLATSLFLLGISAVPSFAQSSSCEETAEVTVLPAPIAPWTGAPLRVLVVAEKPLAGEFSLTAPDGSVVQSSGRQGGPPYFWVAEVKSPAAGTWHATLALSDGPAGCSTITRDITVADSAPAGLRGKPGSVWPIRNTWNRETENLYSAWIQILFDAPLDQDLSWPVLTNVLRDRSRNLLFNYLGLGEDQMGIVYHPDCAKFPYFLRAYFAFKMGLPYGYSRCSRGKEGRPPSCLAWFNTGSGGGGENPAASFRSFLPVLANTVQTGNGRTSAADNNTDFYPVALSQNSLRPGTVYADPYGHFLMLVRRVPQAGGKSGIFLAADAEPDGSVTRKRFWRGNFLFVHDPSLGSPGFKRFRPIERTASGSLHRLNNAEIAKDAAYGDFSLEQAQLGMDAFYDRMDEVMSPEPLDPTLAMEDAITSLEEQVKTRVTAVENGRKYQAKNQGDAGMPDGASIFETNGAWEDFATPARDFRVLIAIDVVRGFPDHVASHADRYAMPAGKSADDVKADLQNMLASELASRKFTYTRSDGSQWTLTLQDVVNRAASLEMAYNLNDCVELRWGAPEGSEEASTCTRHAPELQRAKMERYRSWFHERHWPTHA